MNIIIGLDPGRNFGYAVLAISPVRTANFGEPVDCMFDRVLEAGTWRGKADQAHDDRVCLIAAQLQKLIKKYAPMAIVLESGFVGKNFGSAMKLCEMRGVAKAVACVEDVDFYEYTPQQVKAAVTGNRLAGKGEVKTAVEQKYNILVDSEDAADAVAVAQAHLLECMRCDEEGRTKEVIVPIRVGGISL